MFIISFILLRSNYFFIQPFEFLNEDDEDNNSKIDEQLAAIHDHNTRKRTAAKDRNKISKEKRIKVRK